MDREQTVKQTWSSLLEAIKDIGAKRPGIMKRQMLLIHHDDRAVSQRASTTDSIWDESAECSAAEPSASYDNFSKCDVHETWPCASELADNLALDFSKIGMTVTKVHVGTVQSAKGSPKECTQPVNSAGYNAVIQSCGSMIGAETSPRGSDTCKSMTICTETDDGSFASSGHPGGFFKKNFFDANSKSVGSSECIESALYLRDENDNDITSTDILISAAEVVVVVGSFGLAQACAVRTDPRARDLVDQALDHARKGRIQLVLVLAQGTYRTAFPNILHNWYTHDFRQKPDYHLCMLRNEPGSDSVPGVLMVITDLSGDKRFEMHYSKFLLRTLARRLPDRNADFVQRSVLPRLRSLLDENSVVSLMSSEYCRELDEHSADVVSTTTPSLAWTSSTGAPSVGRRGIHGGACTSASTQHGTAVGKTAIAIDYAWTSLDKKSYAVVRWFDGSTGSLELQFRALAAELHLVTIAASGAYSDVVAAVYERLTSLPVSYLLVFDDVPSHQCIHHVLPPRGTPASASTNAAAAAPVASTRKASKRSGAPAVLHHVLVTSSAHPTTLQRESMVHHCYVDVPVLSRDEADLWLRAELPMIDDDDITRLHHIVCGLAGGVAMLVAQLWVSDKEVDAVLAAIGTAMKPAPSLPPAGQACDSALESGLIAGAIQVSATQQMIGGPHRPHRTLMHMCLEDVRAANPLAAQMSSVLAYCNHPVVPFWILLRLVALGVFRDASTDGGGDVEGTTIARASAALQVLKEYRVCRCSNATISQRRAYTDESRSDDLIRFNVFSHQCIVQADAADSNINVWTDRVAPLLHGLTVIVRHGNERVPFVGGVAIRKATAATELLAACLGRVMATFPGASTLSTHTDDGNGNVVVAACSAVAHALLHLQQPQRAFSFLRHAVDVQTLRPTGTATADLCAGHLLGTVYNALGDHHSAIAVLETVDTLAARAPAPRAATVVARQLDLAQALGGVGRLRDQAATLRSAMGTLQTLHGRTHFSLLSALRSLATLHGQLGQVEKRHECLKTTLDVYQQSYLHRDKGVCATLVALGMTAGSLGLYGETVGYLEQALKLLEAQDNHQETARVLQLLGNAHGATGAHAKSKELLQRCLSLQVKYLGKTHTDVSTTMISLGNTYGNLGDTDRKAQLLQQALTALRRTLPPLHPDIARAMTDLANTHIALGDFPQAISLLKSSIAIKREVFGDNHVETSKTLASLGVCWIHTGNLQQARVLLEQALAVKIRHYGDGHVETANVLFSMSQLCGAERNTVGQISHLRQVLRLKRAAYGNGHTDVAHVLQELASAHLYGGTNLGEAVDLLHESVAILEDVFGSNSSHLAGGLQLLAKALVGAKRYREKLAVFQRLLHLEDASMDKPSRIQTLANVGLLHWALGNRTEAVAAMSDAASACRGLSASPQLDSTLQLFGVVRAYLTRMMEQDVTTQV